MMHKILELQQGTPEWMAHRAKSFNASDAAAMMGCSKFTTRNELLRQMATGIAKEVDAATQRRFNQGHAAEAIVRQRVEEKLGLEFFPVTAAVEIDGLPLSASYDGLTMDETMALEVKLWNQDLARQIEALDIDPHYYWQLEQQLLVVGAESVFFCTGDAENLCMMTYYAHPGRRAQLLAGWKQFQKDLAEFKAQPVQAAPTGHAPDTLPALLIEVTGQVTASNLAEFKATALGAIRSVNRELTTDQHFADAEQAVKWCAEVEDRLKAAKEHALSQTATIDALFKTIDDISAEARKVRLDLDKLVKARKESIRIEISEGGQKAFREHLDSLDKRLGGQFMPTVPSDFILCCRNKRTVASLRDAVDTELARAKIAANAIADRIQLNLNHLRAEADEFNFLFADAAIIVLKEHDDFKMLVRSRISEHKAFEEKSREAERERIRAEEAAKLQRQQSGAAQEITQAPQTVIPMRPTGSIVGASKPIDDGRMLALGKINARLGFNVTADFLWELGFQSKQEKNARLYPEAQFPAICAALIRHIQEVSAEKVAA